MADYSGSFSGSFEGDGSLVVGVNWGNISDAPPTITPFQANSITANTAFRNNFNTNVKNRLNAEGVISSSAQVDYGSISNVPSGIVSSSQQTKDYLPSGVVSSSQQTIQNLPNGTISGSVQVDYGSISNIPSGIVSSSTQIVSNLVGQDVVVQSISGSFSGSFEGNLIGTASYAETASYVNPLTQSVQITGSLDVNGSGNFTDGLRVTGSLTVSGSSTFTNYGPAYLLDGNVGIGTTSPTEKLTIEGNISASGDLSIQGFPSVSESLSSPGKITYDTASGGTFNLTNIQVNDYDDNVAINFINGKLTFTFGTPTEPSSLDASLSGFEVDRFNKVTDNYTINGTWNNGQYTLISASLYEDSNLLAEVGTGTSLTFNTTTSGSHTYRLEYTASSPLDGTLFKSSDTITGTLSKSDPTAPSISRTYNVQLRSGNNIEEGATGSIAFTTSSGALNGWEYTGGSTSPSTSPATVTATGNVTIEATANYQSPSGDNIPQLNRIKTSDVTSNRIRSLRYGTSTATSFSESEIQDIDEWVNNIGTIDVGTINPNNQEFTITTSAEYIYIIYDKNQSDLNGILNVNNSNSNDLGVFSKTVVGNYNVYKSNNLSSTTILYRLTT